MKDVMLDQSKNNLLKIIYGFIFLLIAIQLMALSYGGGGGWVANEFIASGLNLRHYGDLYKTPNEGYLSIKSCYTPGLAIIISLIPISDINILNALFLVLAILVCLTFLVVLHKPITLNLKGNTQDIVFINIIIVGIIGTFAVYLTRSVTFKPDSLVIIIIIASTLLLTANKKNKLLINLFVLTISFFGLLFKQQFLFSLLINVCFILYNTLYKKQFLNFVLIILFSIILCVALFRAIIIEYAFIKPSGHSLAIKNGLMLLFESFKVRHVLHIITFLVIIGYCKKFFFDIRERGIFSSVNKIENLLLLHAICWFFAQLVSAFKYGGDLSNMELSLVLFIPFVAKQINDEVKTFNKRLTFSISLLFLVTCITISITYRAKTWLQENEARKSIIKSLSQDIGLTKESDLLIPDDFYMDFKKLSYNNLNSFSGIFSFFLDPEKNNFDFLSYFEKRINAEPHKIQYIVLDSELPLYFKNTPVFYSEKSLSSNILQKLSMQFFLIKTYYNTTGQPILYIYKNTR